MDYDLYYDLRFAHRPTYYALQNRDPPSPTYTNWWGRKNFFRSLRSQIHHFVPHHGINGAAPKPFYQ